VEPLSDVGAKNALASLTWLVRRDTLARLLYVWVPQYFIILGIMSCIHCQESPCIATDFGDEAIRMGRQESENRGEEGNSARGTW
jgi:hypothetical protein